MRGVKHLFRFNVAAKSFSRLDKSPPFFRRLDCLSSEMSRGRRSSLTTGKKIQEDAIRPGRPRRVLGPR